jgi:hypothetical protein
MRAGRPRSQGASTVIVGLPFVRHILDKNYAALGDTPALRAKSNSPESSLDAPIRWRDL